MYKFNWILFNYLRDPREGTCAIASRYKQMWVHVGVLAAYLDSTERPTQAHILHVQVESMGAFDVGWFELRLHFGDGTDCSLRVWIAGGQILRKLWDPMAY